ncbi:response regulator [Streptomyces sp. NPDC057027]|uniref:response regulator n=1 Tax=Streptomyces sp. NPDC057027 TaxID=3346004 RepID=UPI003626C257
MSGPDTIRILLADDQETIRAGFRLVLDAQPDMTVIGEAADGVTAPAAALRLRPGVLLADIRMPGLDGLELARRLAGLGADPLLRVVVTTFDLDEYVHTALRAGASGFLLKRSGPALLVEVVRATMSGDALISPRITARMPRRLVPPARPETTRPPAEPLPPREEEVATLVAGGMSNADIGEELFISLATVKSHVAGLQRKLSVRNRVGIAAWAWESGLAPTEQAYRRG